MKERNLRRLANHLLNVPPERFYMASFVKNGDFGLDAPKNGFCGTAACAVGHAATLFPQAAYDNLDSIGEIEYGPFSAQVFGVDRYSSEWAFMFRSAWPNDPIKAAARILFVCDGKEIEWSAHLEHQQQLADEHFAEHYKIAEVSA